MEIGPFLHSFGFSNSYVGLAQKFPIGWIGRGEEQMKWEFLGDCLGKEG